MLHPKSAIERLILPRSRGGRGVMNLQWLHDKQVSNIKKYFNKKKSISKMHQVIVEADRGLTTTRLREQEQETEEKCKKEEYNRNLLKQWKRKTLHGRYPAELEQEGVDKKASVMWLTDGHMTQKRKDSW